MRERKLRICTYTPFRYSDFSENRVADLAEAGVDLAIIWGGKQLPEVVAALERHGVGYLIADGAVNRSYDAGDGHGVAVFDPDKAAAAGDYAGNPGFFGHSFVDEPGIIHFEELGRSVEDYLKAFPTKMPYINLLPMYANAAQLLGGAWKDSIDYYTKEEGSFENYLRRYVELVPTDYICVDIYPCRADSTYDGYLRCIEAVAEACRDSGREFWVCVQTCSWHKSVREPSEAELRWQVYTMLAFGVVSLMYYVYCGDREPRGEYQHRGACVTQDGERQELWYASRRLRRELDSLSEAYLPLEWKGAFTVGCTGETPYMRMEHPLSSFPAAESISSSQPLLAGCLAGEGRYGLVLVNMSDPSRDPQPSQVRIASRLKLTAYIDGAPLPLSPDSDGVCTLTLPACGGALVIAE